MKTTTKLAIAAATLAGVALMGMQPARAEGIVQRLHDLRARGTEYNSGINYLSTSRRATPDGEMVATTEPATVIAGDEGMKSEAGGRGIVDYLGGLRHTTPNTGNASFGR
jgi:hypothetical protein